MDVDDWWVVFLQRCADDGGVAVSDGAFSAGPAIWVGRREVAHFDDDHTLDVRLTKSVIRLRRAELKADPRVTLRAASSDWIEVALDRDSDRDVDRARALVVEAIAANRETAPPGPPPTGAELEHRRRFH